MSKLNSNKQNTLAKARFFNLLLTLSLIISTLIFILC
jgi:hypothetical protein